MCYVNVSTCISSAVMFQGKIHLNVTFERNRNDEYGDQLHVQIFEACDLTMVNANCDPFVEVTVKFTNGKQETHRTKVKKKTNCPMFDEKFIFTVIKVLSLAFKIQLWYGM